MKYQLSITLSENEYLTFNIFHSFESAPGKKTVRKTRIIYIAVMVILIALVFLLLGRSVFSVVYALLLGLITIVYMLLFKKILTHNMKSQIKKLKKLGKLPYDPVSSFEFFDDKLVESTASKRIEHSYSDIERICVVKDRFILLYYSSIGAYTLPISQVTQQLNPESFLSFLAEKCSQVEYY